MRRWIIAYDVTDHRGRSRLAAVLLRHGVRRQGSVYECVVDDHQLEALVDDARRLIAPGRDRFEVIAQCRDCAALRRTLGPHSDQLEALYFLI